MCQNLIKYQRIVPIKLIKTAGGVSQDTNHGLIGVGGEIPDQNVVALPWKIPLLTKRCQTLIRL